MNRPTDRRILKIFLLDISDSERNFVDLPMAADCGSVHFLSQDFGICVFKKYFARISDSEGNFIGEFENKS